MTSKGKSRFYGFLYVLVILGPLFAAMFVRGLVEGSSVKYALVVAFTGTGVILAIGSRYGSTSATDREISHMHQRSPYIVLANGASGGRRWCW